MLTCMFNDEESFIFAIFPIGWIDVGWIAIAKIDGFAYVLWNS